MANQNNKPRDRTLKQWNEMGYRVLRGMHAKYHNAAGVALFSRTQVAPSNSVRYGEHPDPWADYEDGIWGPEDEVAMDYY